ncbi:hypothetical protein HHK36_003194 [Tetracentron sinense]|uniref:Uncharacterized protein n=1 Tax=Tetracentron sinense TaxID=13715 RepID=A0A834ZXV4_TETSI|nr:hypothetical protein HHK36_003194 [Tetracentron sinense]
MEMDAFKDAFDRVAKKQMLSSSKAQEVIDQVGQEIKQALEKMQSVYDPASSVDQKSILTELETKLNEVSPLNQLKGSQEELNVELRNYVNLLKTSFNPDISKAYRYVDFDIHTVNQIIASHFYRQGLFDIGDCLINEARESDASDLKSPFQELYQILEAIRSMKLKPALNWVATNHDRVMQNGSSLELQLHQLQFVEILQKDSRNNALKYARLYLAPLASLHMADIQKLMVCLLWARRVDCSPYPEFLSPIQWEKLAEELARQFFSLMGQSCESPLSVVVAAGIQGLPTLLNLVNGMAAKQQEWQEMEQLPVPVDLGWEFQFHSIFICPISFEQVSKSNPPMLMPCCHMLSWQSINSMPKDSTLIFRCPFSCGEMDIGQCRQLYF